MRTSVVSARSKMAAGGTVTIEAGEKPIEILFVCSERLGEPIAWYGPIVMNTQQELLDTLDEIDLGTFIKKAALYEND